MEAKKISFGFSKIKKPTLLNNKAANSRQDAPKVELIKCLEGQEIKLVAEQQQDAPLIIPMIGSTKTSTALASLLKRRAVLLGEEETAVAQPTQQIEEVLTAASSASENIEQRAARELLAEVQNNAESLEVSKLVLPILKPDELPLDGAKEASLEDYEQIPIQQFGLAMLRGMGWREPETKKNADKPADDAPFLRPKGMGLGADKALKAKPLLVPPEANEVLAIKKQAFIRILGGKHKDLYGQIEGFDDHAARVIVKMAIGGAKVAFNEFLCQAVSKQEFANYGKCINSTKYDEYKKMENEAGQIMPKQQKLEVKTETKHSVKTEYQLQKSQASREQKLEKERYYKEAYSDEERNEERKQRSKYDKPCSSQHRDDASSSKSKTHRRNASASSSDSNDATDSESDADSAHEQRRHKSAKKSSHKTKSHKKTSSKSKKHNRADRDDSTDSRTDENNRRKHDKNHKKKTKKSKRERSRSRSRDRRR